MTTPKFPLELPCGSTDLPMEILVKIFEYITSYLPIMRSVCRAWHYAARPACKGQISKMFLMGQMSLQQVQWVPMGVYKYIDILLAVLCYADLELIQWVRYNTRCVWNYDCTYAVLRRGDINLLDYVYRKELIHSTGLNMEMLVCHGDTNLIQWGLSRSIPINHRIVLERLVQQHKNPHIRALFVIKT
jgi:hypothetical protein